MSEKMREYSIFIQTNFSVTYGSLIFLLLDIENMFRAESRDQKSERGFDQKSKDVIESREKSTVQRPHLSGANKRMFNLLKKAKVQLIKIDQQKHLKSSGVWIKIF